MQTEVLPVVNRFQLTEDTNSLFPQGVPWVCYFGSYKDLHINVIWPGKDPTLGVFGVACFVALAPKIVGFFEVDYHSL